MPLDQSRTPADRTLPGSRNRGSSLIEIVVALMLVTGAGAAFLETVRSSTLGWNRLRMRSALLDSVKTARELAENVLDDESGPPLAAIPSRLRIGDIELSLLCAPNDATGSFSTYRIVTCNLASTSGVSGASRLSIETSKLPTVLSGWLDGARISSAGAQ